MTYNIDPIPNIFPNLFMLRHPFKGGTVLKALVVWWHKDLEDLANVLFKPFTHINVLLTHKLNKFLKETVAYEWEQHHGDTHMIHYIELFLILWNMDPILLYLSQPPTWFPGSLADKWDWTKATVLLDNL